MNDDNSFSTFMLGLTVGVAGALLLGTEEGRQISRRILDSLSTQTKDLLEPSEPDLTGQTDTLPPPFFNRPSSKPTYFHDNGKPLEP